MVYDFLLSPYTIQLKENNTTNLGVCLTVHCAVWSGHVNGSYVCSENVISSYNFVMCLHSHGTHSFPQEACSIYQY